MSHPTFDPARTPERDADGHFHHPDLEQLLCDATEPEELVLDTQKLHAAGFSARYLSLADDGSAGDLCARVYTGEATLSEWNPEPQPGETLVAIYPTQDGEDYAMFVKRLEG